MWSFGAEQVLIDGAIDRRAASSPAVADGLVIATGAILDEEMDEDVAATKDAVDLVTLPVARGRRVTRESVVGEEHLTLERGLVLNAEPAEIAALLRGHPRARARSTSTAHSASVFSTACSPPGPSKPLRLRIVASDPTKVFLSHRGPDWYRRQGLAIEVMRDNRFEGDHGQPRRRHSRTALTPGAAGADRTGCRGRSVLDVLDKSPT